MGRHRSTQEWQTLFQDQKSSGLSVTQYCQSKDIKAVSFYHAHNRIQAVTLHKVAIVEAVSKTIQLTINGVLFEVDSTIDGEFLKKLIEASQDV